VEFVVSNAVDPARPPLTPELVAQIFEGCKKSQPTRRMTALSEGIGLEHSLMAARIGGITISLGQEGDIVIFRAVLEAVPGPINPSEGTDSSPFLVTSSSPPNLSHVRPRDQLSVVRRALRPDGMPDRRHHRPRSNRERRGAIRRSGA